MLGLIRRRLALKLTAAYLAALCAVTAGVGILLVRQVEKRFLDQLETSIATHARLMAQTLPAGLIRARGSAALQLSAKNWAEQVEGRVTVVDSGGVVLADSGVPAAELPLLENHRGRPEIQTALRGGVGRSIRRSATVRQKLFYVAVPLKEGTSVIGILRVALPLTHVDQMTGAVGRTLAAGLAILVIGVILLSAVLALRITRPLTAMAISARRIAQGDLTTRTPVMTQDEIAQVGQAFNAMAEQLQAKIQELEASRSQIEGILQSMMEGVLVVGPDGNVILVNEAAREILSLGSEAIPARPLSELVRHPDLQDLIRRVLETEEPQFRDLTLYAPAERHLRIHATACRAPTGRGALMVLHDITDLKRLENLRRDFVANVSHELKTPLTAIQGAVETLLDGALKDPVHGRPFLESIAEESARLGRLVDDLLTLAQVESRQTVLRKRPISIDSFLQQEVERHRPLARTHQVSLVLEPVPSDPSLDADRDQLAQAVGNLLDNGIKYNRPHGRVTVRAVLREGQCRIVVEDTGIGIPAEDLPRIFERFYRVDKARSRETGGTGLGLSIVKHVAEAHGGTVQVESRPGQGTTFTLILPLG